LAPLMLELEFRLQPALLPDRNQDCIRSSVDGDRIITQRRRRQMRLVVAATVLTLTSAVTFSPSLQADSGERFLSDYANDDGSRPDGSDGKRDDTTALNKALADGPGVVRLGRGYYRLGDIQIPENVTLQGQGKATVIRSNGASSIFRQAG